MTRRCAVCGRDPQAVLTSAVDMRRCGYVLSGFEARVRYRLTRFGTDMLCWWCEGWVARYGRKMEGVNDHHGGRDTRS
jgi:hypothetical protein